MTTAPVVLVVGAGPVGLIAAAELDRHGVPVRIIDKLARPTDESRAIAVHARSLDMLARIGVVEELIDTGVRARGMTLYSGGHELLRVPLDEVDAVFPFSLNTPQTETERVLTKHLTALGITIERSVELTQLGQDDDAVHVGLRHGNGRDEELSVAWVVGADGAHSTVRHLLGTQLEGVFVGERFLLGDVDAEHHLDPEAMHTFFSPDGPVLAMPMRHGRMRVMAQVRPTEGTPIDEHPSLAQLQAVVTERVGGITLQRAHWLTTFGLHHAQVNQYRWGRVLLTGDAAHIHSPAGGQGMNTGMQDAFNLAWKLAAVSNGRAGDALLDTYHAERHPVAKKMIDFTTRLSKAGTLAGPPQHVRNALMKAMSHVGPFTRAVAETTAEVNVGYQGGPLALSTGPWGAHVVAGQHFPHLAERVLESALWAAWGADHTTLTVVGDHRGIPRADRGVRQLLVADTADPLDGYDAVIADPKHALAQRIGLPHGGRVVIRPDTYIGAVDALDDPTASTNYFTSIAH